MPFGELINSIRLSHLKQVLSGLKFIALTHICQILVISRFLPSNFLIKKHPDVFLIMLFKSTLQLAWHSYISKAGNSSENDAHSNLRVRGRGGNEGLWRSSLSHSGLFSGCGPPTVLQCTTIAASGSPGPTNELG